MIVFLSFLDMVKEEELKHQHQTYTEDLEQEIHLNKISSKYLYENYIMIDCQTPKIQVSYLYCLIWINES